jgi:hypothetical protein
LHALGVLKQDTGDDLQAVGDAVLAERLFVCLRSIGLGKLRDDGDGL